MEGRRERVRRTERKRRRMGGKEAGQREGWKEEEEFRPQWLTFTQARLATGISLWVGTLPCPIRLGHTWSG